MYLFPSGRRDSLPGVRICVTLQFNVPIRSSCGLVRYARLTERLASRLPSGRKPLNQRGFNVGLTSVQRRSLYDDDRESLFDARPGTPFSGLFAIIAIRCHDCMIRTLVTQLCCGYSSIPAPGTIGSFGDLLVATDGNRLQVRKRSRDSSYRCGNLVSGN